MHAKYYKDNEDGHGAGCVRQWFRTAEPLGGTSLRGLEFTHMLNVCLAGDHLLGIAVYLAVAGGVYDGVFLCCPFSHEMSWMRSWT